MNISQKGGVATQRGTNLQLNPPASFLQGILHLNGRGVSTDVDGCRRAAPNLTTLPMGVDGCRRESMGANGWISILTEIALGVDGCRRVSAGVDGCRRVDFDSY